MFDDVVDIASTPARVATRVTDAVVTLWQDTPITDAYNEIRDTVRISDK